MAIVKTTASGGNVPEKKNSTSKTPATRAGGPQVRQGTNPADSKTFLQDTMAELRRVVWPSREQVWSGVFVTIGLLVFFSVYIFLLDRGFTAIFQLLGIDPKLPN